MPTTSQPVKGRGPAPSDSKSSVELQHSFRLRMKEVASKGGAGKGGAGKSTDTTGTVIVSQFPYASLTDKEIVNLYTLSGFSLGNNEDEQLHVVHCLKSLSKARFNASLSSLLSSKASDPSSPPTNISSLILDIMAKESSSTNV